MSQISQLRGDLVASDATLETVFVLLCDWQGRCEWSSMPDSPLKQGDLVWKNLTRESQEVAKALLSRVVALGETHRVEVVNLQGVRSRAWLWPLGSPDVAVCVLGMRIPAELSRLTERELECLELLAQGIETRDVARELGVSLSTIHTHMRRAREKLGLPTVESLISYAARYCYPARPPLAREHA